MNQMYGYLKEKMGKSINKAMIARKVADIEVPVCQQIQETVTHKGKQIIINKSVPVMEKTQVLIDGKITDIEVPKITKKPLFRIVKQHFFTNNETILTYKDRDFEVSPKTEAYTRGEVHVHFFDFDSGDRLDMSGVVLAQANPLDLHLATDVAHIKQWKKGQGASFDWFYILFLVLGVFIGYVITPYLTGVLNPSPVNTLPVGLP